MDWNHVTAQEVFSALREVSLALSMQNMNRYTASTSAPAARDLRVLHLHDIRCHSPPTLCMIQVEWKEPPRPLWEMLQPSRFSVPRSRKKWAARTKNSVFYYRVNYALALLLCTAAPLLRRPTALLAVAACTLALLCLNDTFATSLR